MKNKLFATIALLTVTGLTLTGCASSNDVNPTKSPNVTSSPTAAAQTIAEKQAIIDEMAAIGISIDNRVESGEIFVESTVASDWKQIYVKTKDGVYRFESDVVDVEPTGETPMSGEILFYPSDATEEDLVSKTVNGNEIIYVWNDNTLTVIDGFPVKLLLGAETTVTFSFADDAFVKAFNAAWEVNKVQYQEE